MRRTIVSAFVALLSCVVHAQDNIYQASFHDHIAIDGGLYLPMGEVATGLGLTGAVGVGVHFWKAVDAQTILVASFGNSWMGLGSSVQTDSGLQDLSGYTLNLTNLLGGVGYAFSHLDLRPFVIIQAGAQFATLKVGRYPPSQELNNVAYFTLGGTAGLSYPVSERISILGAGRYLHMFGEDLQHIDVLMGVSFRL